MFNLHSGTVEARPALDGPAAGTSVRPLPGIDTNARPATCRRANSARCSRQVTATAPPPFNLPVRSRPRHLEFLVGVAQTALHNDKRGGPGRLSRARHRPIGCPPPARAVELPTYPGSSSQTVPAALTLLGNAFGPGVRPLGYDIPRGRKLPGLLRRGL